MVVTLTDGNRAVLVRGQRVSYCASRRSDWLFPGFKYWFISGSIHADHTYQPKTAPRTDSTLEEAVCTVQDIVPVQRAFTDTSIYLGETARICR